MKQHLPALPFAPEWRSRVERRIAKVGDCWRWTGNYDSQGCPQIKINYRTRSAYRVTYVAFVGEIPAAHFLIRGECPDRACVKPKHLRLVSGTHGDRNPLAKFSDRAVAALRRRARSEGIAALARAEGVHLATMYRLVRRETYRG